MIKIPTDPRLSGLYAFDASINTDGDIKLFDFNTGPNFAAFTRGNKALQFLLHRDVLHLMKLYLIQRFEKMKELIVSVMTPKLKA